MVATDFLDNPQVRKWLDGAKRAWTLLTSDSLRALRQEPSASQAVIRIANNLSAHEIAGSALARNTFILLRQAIERGGLSLTATGRLSRAVVAEMCKLIEWPGYDQADAFRLHNVVMSLISCRCISSGCSRKQHTARQVSGDALGKVDAKRCAAR